MRRKLILGLVMFLGLPLTALAQSIDLRGAIREAIEQRPFARAAMARAEAAKAGADEVRGAYLPKVMLQENFVRTSQPGNGLFIALNQEDFALSPTEDLFTIRENFETRLSLEQPLLSTELYYGIRQAREEARAAEAEAEWRAEEAAFVAFQAYLEVQRTRAALEAAESSRAEADEVLRLARLRREAGIGMKADELRARVALSEAERRLLTVRNDLRLARRFLALALGRGSVEIDIAESLTPKLFDDGMAGIPLQRGDLAALEHRAKAARESYRGSSAAYLPSIGAGAAYEMHDPQTPFGDQADHWSVRVGLSWTLFDGLQREKAQSRSAAELRAAEQMRHEAARQALWTVEEATLRASEARFHLETARQAVAEAAESHRLLQERYSAGLTELSDLLAVRAALDRARADAVNAESRLILALGNVRFQSGVFVQTLLHDKEIDR